MNNKLRRQGYCITSNPTLEQVNTLYYNIKSGLDKYGQFTIDNSNNVRQIKKTKKVKKGFRNFESKVKTYTAHELILCNNYIGSIIFNFPNILANSYNGDLKGLVSLYEEYMSLALHFMSNIDQNIVDRINKYIKKTSLHSIFKDINTNNKKVELDTIMKLYTWYFTLCKIVNSSQDSNEIYITKFTKKFKKYIVKTCTAYKTVNEKTKKLNTCRRNIV